MKEINLCQNCIKDLEIYNPYIEPIKITKVDMKKCINYTQNGIFINEG